MEVNINIKKLYLLKSIILKSKNNNDFYLNMEQKKNILKDKGFIPLRVKGNGRKVKIIVKTRGTIESGYLKGKKMGL